MRLTSHRNAATYLLLVSLAACQEPARTPASAGALPDSVAGIEWSLVELGGRPAATGASGRRATLRFEVAPPQASGFAGCNRFTARYSASGDALRFEAAAMTRMACAEGMELESAFAGVLADTRRYEIAGGDLVLVGPSGPLARFARAAP
jgi:heat shock protein HslJ